ncbi:MAG TPA: prepilin peptidase [Verrucomicrobiota bacterium]|nr:prepilin peptidase [Verrucomicrobiota bacterium]HNT14819.1 prepilin peptidase [Verrucomicrobiota bacterium]
MFETVFNPEIWARVPFHLWSVMFFLLGSIVGSFLNVCIYRLPRGLSVVTPPSHCPHCQYSIPWHLNLPLITWLLLRGRCRQCRAPISIRYFLVELLTGALFLGCWLNYGPTSARLALIFSLFAAGLVVATCIDFEHFIIPDEITLGGVAAGLLFSFYPPLHEQRTALAGFWQGVVGALVGWGLVYGIVRLGKVMFGRQRVALPVDTRIVFSETAVHLPDRDIPYEELFYRQSDEIIMQARTLELIDRCYQNVKVRLSPRRLRIEAEEFNPEAIHQMEAVSTEIVLPREAMGFGDVKFMAAIGAFLGWPATLFALVVSSVIGSVVGVAGMMMQGRERFARIPYGPYLAAAALIWVFLPLDTRQEVRALLAVLNPFAAPGAW